MRKRRKRSKMRRAFFFYPGGILAKRIGCFIILYSIALNLYVNVLQKELALEAQCVIEETEESVKYYRNIGKTAQDVIQQSTQYAAYNADDIFALFYLQKVKKKNDETIQRIEEKRDAIKAYTDRLKEYAKTYSALSILLRLLTYLFWIRVFISSVWLTGDYLYGNAKKPIMFFLVLGIGVNIFLYEHLTQYYPLAVLLQGVQDGALDTLEDIRNIDFSYF